MSDASESPKGYRFPKLVISHAVYLYHRLPISYRDVQELPFKRGINVSHGTIRTWCLKFRPDLAEKVVLVTDNLNTHSTAALYEAFVPEEAHANTERIEWHYTPEHGSWLNMAEIELSAGVSLTPLRSVLEGYL